MTALIKREPDDPQHYTFRATLHRLRDDLRRAQSDYERVMKLSPESPVGPNGLAEIHLQKGQLEEARRWADEAYQKAPDDWIAVYNLGMIAERQQDDEAALRYLNEALNLKMSGSRHRLLAKFWLAKIHYRRSETHESEKAVRELAKEKSGLREWQAIMESPESASIRATMQDDIRMAKALAEGKSLADVFDAG
jgi:tetratricopeptide (TPR) repeat protein